MKQVYIAHKLKEKLYNNPETLTQADADEAKQIARNTSTVDDISIFKQIKDHVIQNRNNEGDEA